MRKVIRAFTVAEMLTAMIVIAVLVAATLPALTIRKTTSTRIDMISENCVIEDNGDTSQTNCIEAANRARQDVMNSLGTLLRYVDFEDNGTSTSELAALKVIRKACEDGGKAACDVFIDRCIADNGLCDISNEDYDLQYFMEKSITDSSVASIYIHEQLEKYYAQDVTNIKSIIQTSCENGGDSSCLIVVRACVDDSNAAACNAIIDGCNNGHNGPCKYGYLNDLNRSCLQIKNTIGATDDKAYGLSYNIVGDSYQAYCDMTNGGWTLVMKADGTQSTFEYVSTNWTTDSVVNASSTDLTKTEHKNMGFSNVSFDNVKLVMNTPVNDTVARSVTIPLTSANLLTLFSGPSNYTTLGDAAWQGLMGSANSSSGLQKNWRTEGFNIVSDPYSSNHSHVRIGITGNNQSGHNGTPDSFIGMGYTYLNQSGAVSVGNYCWIRCKYVDGSSGPDDINTASFAYLYVK